MLLKQLQYFIAVAECRHFTRAADKLFVSQSALSQQITKLENDFGLKLINRNKHPIELTPAGTDFFIHATSIAQNIEQMQLQMQKYLPLERRTIHLGMITGLGNINIAGILRSFSEKYPDINFNITNKLSKELCRMLQEHKIDLGIFAAPYHIEEYPFEVLPLENEEFVLIVPRNHPLAKCATIHLADASQEKYIFPTVENVSYDIFITECKRAGFSPKIISECNSPGRRIDLVQGGLGISLISLSGLRYHNHPDVAVVRLKAPFYKQMVLARTKQEDASPVITALWNYIQQKR